MSDVLDILLAGTARNVQKEPDTLETEMVRLSKAFGAPVIFKLQGLTYNQVKKLNADPDMDVNTVLEGVVSPSFQDLRLAYHYGILKDGEPWLRHGKTPADLVRAMLVPGECRELCLKIQRLSGFQAVTTKDIKKTRIRGGR